MKAHLVSLALVVPVAFGSMGCSKLKSAVGLGDDDGGGASSSPLAFLSSFEGEIDVTAKSKGPGGSSDAPMNVALFVKGNKMRAEVPEDFAREVGGKGYFILNGDEKKLYFVSDVQKQVIVLDLNQAGDHIKTATQALPRAGGSAGASKPPPKITKTGKTDTVAGHTCETWEVLDTETSDKMVVCVADEGASWFHVPLTGAPAQYAWAGELLDGKHFPLRGVAFNKAGAEEGRIEVTKMDKKSVADSQFVYPPAYKVVDVAQMLGGLGAAGGLGLPGGAGGLGGPGGLGGHGGGHGQGRPH